MRRQWMVLVLAGFSGLLLSPSVARAQFTTFVPSKRVVDSAKTAVKKTVIAAKRAAMPDSVSHAEIANMKTWVDSAAGMTAIPAAADTMPAAAAAAASPSIPTSLPMPLNAAHKATTTFSNGTTAPETASALPLLALLGLGAIGVGMFLLCDEPKAVRVVASRSGKQPQLRD